MTATEQHLIQAEQISSGLSVLKKRQSKLSWMSVGTSLIFVLSTIAIFVQHDFVYGFFGLTQSIEQLHLPYSIDAAVMQFNHYPDHFFNLLAWFGWLILKVTVSFIGAFVVMGLLKKIRFFAIRFQSFVLKFVAWLIAVIVIWSGLTFVQYDMKDDEYKQHYELVHYEQHIQQSQIARLLNESETHPTIKAYVLAQTALLHKPVDKDVAISYVAQLIQAERTQTDFVENGFKPEQLWTLQHQLYGKSMTPIAKGVEQKVQKAEQLATIVEMVLLVIAALSLLISLALMTLSSRIKKRTQRIEQQIL